jgi:uncharacterized protein YndB with AHSA1/START domain
LPHAENMVVIAAPITDVFAFIADGTNNPQWQPVAGATTVRFSLDLEAHGLMKVPMRFAGKVIERQMRAEVDCLSRLKDLFEAGPEKDEEAAEAEPEAEPQA